MRLKSKKNVIKEMRKGLPIEIGRGNSNNRHKVTAENYRDGAGNREESRRALWEVRRG